MQARLEQVIDSLRQAKTPELLNRYIASLRDTMEVEHLIYHSVNHVGEQWAALTYDPKWVSQYINEDYARIDPVVKACFSSNTGFDWKSLNWTARPVRKFMAEAQDAGVGQQGFTVPIHGPRGKFAAFTVNDRVRESVWDRYTQRMARDFLLIGHYVNQQALVLESERAGTGEVIQNLSPREVDALTYLALGYSRGQTADSLKISEHTLRVYIESARNKLNALNTTHAVARAVTMGLLVL